MACKVGEEAAEGDGESEPAPAGPDHEGTLTFSARCPELPSLSPSGVKDRWTYYLNEVSPNHIGKCSMVGSRTNSITEEPMRNAESQTPPLCKPPEAESLGMGPRTMQVTRFPSESDAH